MAVYCSLHHENPDGSAFCDECGEPLTGAIPAPVPDPAVAMHAPDPAPVAAPTYAPSGEQICPSCGSTNPAGEAFCSNCGSVLDAATVPAVVPAPAIPVSVTPVPLTATQIALVVEADNQEFDLSGKDSILIGREDAVSNIFPDIDLTAHGGEEGGVSRVHAHIFVENGQYMIEDENSTNFTFLNRQRLAAKTPTPLNDNDEVKLGRVLLRFKAS